MKRRVPRLHGKARDVARGELIGKEATIVKANDAGIQGRGGTIVDETLRTLTLDECGRHLQVPKRGCVFRIDGVDVDGYAIEFRSEDRTKKVR